MSCLWNEDVCEIFGAQRVSIFREEYAPQSQLRLCILTLYTKEGVESLHTLAYNIIESKGM